MGRSPIVDAWREWVADPLGIPARRRLLVQILNTGLAYRWQSFDVAVENFRMLGTPEDSRNQLRDAVAIARRHDWNAAAVRRELR